MSDGLRDQLRTILEEHRGNLRHEIEELGADPDTDDTSFADDRGFADSAHSTAERSRMLSLLTALRENLHDVQRALRRMDEGTYGACERCRKPIAPERLEALPWASLCIDCKQKEGSR